MSIPTEAMTPAQEAWFDYRKDYGSWTDPMLAQVHKHFIAGYEAAQTDKLAIIAAQAKAEALREAADTMPGWMLVGLAGEYDGNEHHRAWLRARAATIEVKGS